MLVVLPVCSKDIELACTNLKLALKFNQSVTEPCLISAPKGVDLTDLNALAAQYFSSVKQFVYDDWMGPKSWPRPQNHAWQSTARYIAEQMPPMPWFWWEADATPLKPGWLRDLSKAYTEGAMPFAGHIVSGQGNGHMNGVGIYPHDVRRFSVNAFLAQSHPFDRIMSKDISRHILNLNHLIGHRLKENRESFHVDSQEDADEVTKTGCVLFHGSSDGSLARTLLGAPSTCVGLIQLLMRWKYGHGRYSLAKTAKRLLQFVTAKPEPRLIHCVERHRQSGEEAERRILAAQDSWIALYKTGRVVPCHLWNYPRSSQAMGDKRDLPYLKDVLIAGLNTGGPDDVLMWTNDDTILHPDIIDAVFNLVAQREAISSFRINFDSSEQIDLRTSPKELLSLSRSLAAPGDEDLGRDMFAFTKPWLRTHWNEIPDFLLGELEFDLILAFMIRKYHQIHTTKLNMAEVIDVCEMPKGYVLHERHNRQWTSKTTEASPAKLHNRKLATEFYADNGLQSLITTKF